MATANFANFTIRRRRVVEGPRRRGTHTTKAMGQNKSNPVLHHNLFYREGEESNGRCETLATFTPKTMVGMRPWHSWPFFCCARADQIRGTAPLRLHPGPLAAGEADRVEEHAAHPRRSASAPGHGPGRSRARRARRSNRSAPAAAHSAMNPQVEMFRTLHLDPVEILGVAVRALASRSTRSARRGLNPGAGASSGRNVGCRLS